MCAVQQSILLFGSRRTEKGRALALTGPTNDCCVGQCVVAPCLNRAKPVNTFYGQNADLAVRTLANWL